MVNSHVAFLSEKIGPCLQPDQGPPLRTTMHSESVCVLIHTQGLPFIYDTMRLLGVSMSRSGPHAAKWFGPSIKHSPRDNERAALDRTHLITSLLLKVLDSTREGGGGGVMRLQRERRETRYKALRGHYELGRDAPSPVVGIERQGDIDFFKFGGMHF